MIRTRNITTQTSMFIIQYPGNILTCTFNLPFYLNPSKNLLIKSKGNVTSKNLLQHLILTNMAKKYSLKDRFVGVLSRIPK